MTSVTPTTTTPFDAVDAVVFGASGLVGRRIAAALAAAGLRIAVAGRRAPALAGLVDGAACRIASAHDPESLARAFAGARVVVNAAGPLSETALPVLRAAIAAGARYCDVGGEQAVLRSLYERCESAVRHAGLLAVPGAGLDGMLADLLATSAVADLQLTPDAPLDELSIAYIFDDLSLSAGSQRALFGAAFARPQIWRRDRWEAAPTGDHRRIDAGDALGGARDAIAYAGGSPITLPRHIPATVVATYASTTRKRSGLMRLVASALPLVPRVTEVLAAYAPPDTDYARTRFAIVVEARRGGGAPRGSASIDAPTAAPIVARAVLRGRDVYATTVAVTTWAAIQLAQGVAGIGVRAPGEVFDARVALRELRALAPFELEPGLDLPR